MARRYGLGFDLEGVGNNAKIDFAWETIDNLSSLGPAYHDRVVRFDEYDDEHWRKQRAKSGHSTGTTPLVSLMVAAIDGIDDKKLIAFAKDIAKPNPGAKEMFEYAKRCGDVFIITNSYPAAALLTAKEIGIPSSSVYTLGYQFYREGREMLNGMGLEEEVEMRSPMGVFLKYRDLLEKFLDKYLKVCERILSFYESGGEDIKELRNAHDIIFNGIPEKELRDELGYLLLGEMGIMGGHRKADALTYAHRRGRRFYIGDGIVDADAIDYADFGTSVNCTNEEALRDSKLNIGTLDFRELIPVLESIRKGEFDPEKLKEELHRGVEEGCVVYTHDDIEKNFAEVVAANKKIKGNLKDMYPKL
jgi:predicted HAD superfamily phosphohydrolase